MDTIKQLWIKLRPYMSEEYDFQYADVEMTLESPQFAAGGGTFLPPLLQEMLHRESMRHFSPESYQNMDDICPRQSNL